VQARPSRDRQQDREVLHSAFASRRGSPRKLCRALDAPCADKSRSRDSIEQGQELFGTGQTLAFPGGLDVDERLVNAQLIVRIARRNSTNKRVSR